MIRLTRIAMREIRLPLAEPFVTSAGVVEKRRILLLELSDSDGATTWSECVAQAVPTYSPDTVDTCWLALAEWLIPAALSQSFVNAKQAAPALEVKVRGHRMARAAVEMGIWSLEALQREMSLAALLTNASDFVGSSAAAPRSFVETGIALGMQPTPEALADRAAHEADRGYRRIKIKIEPGRDVSFARAASAAVEGRTPVSVDANCSYSLDDPAEIAALEALDSLGLAMIEQPLAHDDLLHHAELQQRLSTPLCLDESVASPADAEGMLSLRSARIVNLKPGRVGGFQQALAIHDVCAREGVPVWCGGMLECGIGRAYNVALASLPNFTLPGDLSPSSRYWERDVILEPWTMDERGRVRVPLDRPGLGIEVDTALVENTTVRRASFSAR